ncbi:hypothetical protein GCM10011360_17450 [Primorskyibacter flagellatus]|uniref:Uncharacterized protein n=1 Tax=Primorskyibacter flagellatus TaxID=1387277 RepID=A0A917EG64_9RHOB|nr:hypothetical protein [Primorskyibacter flagellatus]GGE29895.1 hypothetical protein GCM10011360_17450 [Primorskyibacter flagellatus]
MAQIRKIVRENPLSNFRQVAPDGGGAFRFLAQGLNALYDRVAPVATDIMTERGAEAGRQEARKRFGETKGLVSEPISESQQIANDAMSAIGKGKNLQYREAIASIESAGSGGYRAIGARHPKLGRALGKYQIMEANIGPWSQEVLGRTVSADEFLASDDIQDQIFDAKFGGYVERFGEAGAAQAWFAGPGGVGKNSRKDVHGTTVGVYGQKFMAAMGQSGTVSTQGNSEPSVMIRGSNGELEARLYSPYSGEILQAHNAAAQVAYVSEVYNKGLSDIMQMSSQYIANPEGFAAAAQSYVDQIVDAAPQDYKSEIRGVLEKEMVRRQLGIMEEKQRDIRNRANNSSAALVERWSTTLEDAIVSGDETAIKEAEAALDGVLQAREALPGVHWTEEQSANVFIKTRRAAEASRERKRREATAESRDHLNLIIRGAKNGASVKDEEMAFDPQVMADHPELAREAQAFLALRDDMPEFLEMTPSEQAQAVARMAAEEVAEEWQLDIVDAARTVAAANQKAWDDDPAARAFEVMKSDPPPALPNLTPDEPEKFVRALTDRRDYMNDLFEKGYTDTRAYLTKEEAESIQSFMGAETPPELRAAMADAIVGGFGEDAVRVFDEIDADDVTMFVGKMMSLGGNPTLAATILRGQQMMAEGLVRVPPKADQVGQFSRAAANAFKGVPGAIAAQSEVMAAAQAIYAADPAARTIEPTSDAATELMAKAVQTALGQAKNKRGQLTGGVQKVMDHDTLLPIGVSGEDLDAAIRKSMRGLPHEGKGFAAGMANMGAALLGSFTTDDAAWTAATAREGFEGGPPLYNGKPIPPKYVGDGNIRIVPAAGNLYRMEIISGSSVLNAEDADGNVFFFDPKKLMEAENSSRPKTSLPLEPFDSAKHQPRDNKDGTFSTEIEITNDAPDGGYWNIPSLWFRKDGTSVQMTDEQAQIFAKKYEEVSGKKFPRFATVKEAEDYAKKRSARGGASTGGLAE